MALLVGMLASAAIILGTKVGLRQTALSRLELGEPAMRLSTLLNFLSALGLEIVIDERGRAAPKDLEELF